MKHYPVFHEQICVKCGECVKGCPVNALNLKNLKKPPKLNKERCINCYCCHELCRYEAITLETSFYSKIINKIIEVGKKCRSLIR